MYVWENIVRSVPLFAQLTEEDFQELFPIVQVKGCLGGVHLFERGDPPDAFYVISSGSVRIDLPPDGQGKARQIPLKAGDFFGEMGVLRCEPRSADAFIPEDSTVLQIKKDDFDELMAVNAGLAERVMQVFLARLDEQERPPGDLSVAPPERKCQVFTFFSPSGGAGTSLLAANVALKARDFTQKRVLLIDADFQFGSLHTMFATTPEPPGACLGAEPSIEGEDFEKHARRLHLGIDLLPAPATVEEAELYTTTQCRSLVLNGCDSYDYLFVDCPSSLLEPNLTFFQQSDRIFLVFTPDMVSVARVVSALHALDRAGLERRRIRLVLNKFTHDETLNVEDLEKRFEQRIFGRINFEPETVLGSLNDGLPVVKRNRSSVISVDLARTARQLLSLPTTEARDGASSFSLFGLFS